MNYFHFKFNRSKTQIEMIFEIFFFLKPYKFYFNVYEIAIQIFSIYFESSTL